MNSLLASTDIIIPVLPEGLSIDGIFDTIVLIKVFDTVIKRAIRHGLAQSNGERPEDEKTIFLSEQW